MQMSQRRLEEFIAEFCVAVGLSALRQEKVWLD
jgi:hypothetical protein